jgi:hypothetical protein
LILRFHAKDPSSATEMDSKNVSEEILGDIVESSSQSLKGLPPPEEVFPNNENQTEECSGGGSLEDDSHDNKRRRKAPSTFLLERDELDNEQLKNLQQAVENSRAENISVDVEIEQGRDL